MMAVQNVSPKAVVTSRLQEAGLGTDRFIDVHDGEKRSTNHTRRPPDEITGNYGIYAGNGLIGVDVDDYTESADADGLSAVDRLPETFTVETPHTDGESGGHRLYRVTPSSKYESAVEACESVCSVLNPCLSWGEIRVRNQYIVGPGSVLDGCDKDWCGDCETEAGGRYVIADDRPIASITADELATLLLHDPEYASEPSDSDDSPQRDVRNPYPSVGVESTDSEYEPVRDAPSPESIVEREVWVGEYLDGGSSDRSRMDFAVCVTMAEYGVPELAVRTLLNTSPHSKVSQRGDSYWRHTWTRAIQHADVGSKTLQQTPSYNLPDLPENPADVMQAVRGNDSFEERWERVSQQPWTGQDDFLHLLKGRYTDAGYTTPNGEPDRSAGELAFAGYVGFWFGRNPRLARYIFEVKASLDKYHENPAHRQNMYEAVEDVDWVYTDIIRLDTRVDVAKTLRETGETTKAVLVANTNASERQVSESLRYLRHENAVSLDRRGQKGAYWCPEDRLSAFIHTYERQRAGPSEIASGAILPADD